MIVDWLCMVGIWDLGSIILMFALNATMNLFGIMMEFDNQSPGESPVDGFHFRSIAVDHPLGLSL